MTATLANRPTVDQALRGLVEPICRVHGVELVDARYMREKGGAVVRIVIDRSRADGQDGSAVNLADCTAISRDVSTLLDLNDDVVSGKYRLEVGSPGLERPLCNVEDFSRFAGREIKLRTRAPLSGRRKFNGALVGMRGSDVELIQDGAPVSIPFEEIVQAHLVYRF